MTNTYNISGGSQNIVRNVMRAFFVLGATIAGFFVFAASAAFVIFIVGGLIILAALAYLFFWLRAKLFRKPFGPKATFEAARKDMEAQLNAATQGHDRRADDKDGPILDAHKTPEGWSVDD